MSDKNKVRLITIQFRVIDNIKWGVFRICNCSTKTAKKNFRHYTKLNCRQIQSIDKRWIDNEEGLPIPPPFVSYFTINDICKQLEGD